MSRKTNKKKVCSCCSHNVVLLPQNLMILKNLGRFVEWNGEITGKEKAFQC